MPLRQQRRDLVDRVAANRPGVDGEEHDDEDEAERDEGDGEASKRSPVCPCHVTRCAIGAPRFNLARSYGVASSRPPLFTYAYRICKSAGIVSDVVSAGDPLLEFALESATVPIMQLPAPARTLIQPQDPAIIQPENPTIDAASRVVSFVLGFALASVLAWVSNLPAAKVSGDIAVAPKAESVARSVESVVTPATPVRARTDPPQPAPVVTTPAPDPPAARATAADPSVARAATPGQRRTPAVSGYRGSLVLSSTPADAQVIVNGRIVGQTPIVLDDLPVGSRAIVVRRDGYTAWSSSVRVVANQRTPVRATLRPLGSPTY